jgi:hypothetical protein
MTDLAFAPGPVTAPAARARTTTRLPRLGLMFWVPLAVYLAVAFLLMVRSDSVMGDALSRVANAHHVLFSRDPHVSAIGFVWSPLPSMTEIPVVLLKPLWPDLAAQGYAGAVQSALFMAGTVVQLHRYTRDLGVSRAPALVLAVLFAINPVIAYYGTNGMSEAAYLFSLVLTARYLGRWLVQRDTGSLAVAGVGLALAYLTRYEAGASGFAVIAAVMFTTWLSTSGTRAERRTTAIADGIIVGGPFAFATVGWALASWIITGQPFEQFTSQYGNSAQTRLNADSINGLAGGGGRLGLLRYMLEQMWVLVPLGAAVAVLAVVVGYRRRDLRPLSPLIVFLPSLAFAVAAFVAGQSFGWLRFSIGVIPLVYLLGAYVMGNTSVTRPVIQVVATVAVLAALLAGLPRTASALTDARLAREESMVLTGVLRPEQATPLQRGTLRRMAEYRDVAGYLDGLDLPEGAVLLDAAGGFGIIVASRHPRQFVITPDRDFPAVLVDPAGNDVRYLLTRGVKTSVNDAVYEAYPGLVAGTEPVARLERTFEGVRTDAEPWKLFRVNGSP